MTDKNKLTEQQKQKIADWLNQHTGQTEVFECPVCKSREWLIGDHLVTSPVATPRGEVLLGGTAYPHAMVISVPCGYTMFFNAVIMGVIDVTSNDEQQGGNQ